MRKNWSHSKLGDICSIERGGSPRPITDYITDSEDGINWIKIGDAIEGSKYITSTKEKIKPEGMKKSRFVHKGDFILSNSMSFGRPYILDIDGCIHDGWLVIHDENSVFVKDYLFYLLSSPVMYSRFEQLAVGGVVNNLNTSLVKNVIVPIPNKQIQKSIASELNKINELITLKKKQLIDLDCLSKSIFYDMFGDPIENEKEWATEVIGKVAPCVSYKGKIVSKEGKYWLLNLDMVESMTGRVIDRKFVEKSEIGNSTFTFNEDNVLYSKLRPYLNKVVIPNGNGYCTSELLPLLPDKKHLNRIFLAFVLRNKSFVDFINIKVAGAKMPRVSMTDFRNFKLILPPLPLQQTFAERISAIEQQKLQISSTIKTLEALLASRMQYWFD